ncbi:MAG TPA: hypothetical protein VGT03_15525 [Candidatus Acidoferrales bacterium]|nr:hypothetical protein [Candidatus Acidoferrales bacterium]
MMLLGKFAIGMLGSVVAAGAVVSSEGFIHVRVHENQANGTHLSLVVPAMIVPVALKFVPRRDLEEPARRVEPWLPLIDAAISGLDDCADGTTLVEVTDRDQHATVVKSGGAIVLDVQDPDETVHVAVPLRAMRSAIHELAAKAGPS